MRKVGRKEDFPEGKAMAIDVDGVSVVICHVEGGKFYAVEDRCSHDDEELAGAELDGCDIICPRHGARFCLRTGAVLGPPAYEPIRAFATRVVDGIVEIQSEG